MDTGKDIDLANNSEQPVNPVAGIAEEGGKPQTANSDDKFVIDIDGDQETADFDENEFKKQQAMAAKRKKQLEKEREEKEQLRKELEELKKQVAQVTAPKKPSLADYDYDEEKFADAMAEYVKSQNQVAVKPQEQKQELEVGDDYELSLIKAKSESKVKTAYPSYDRDMSEFEQKITDNGGDPEVAKNAIAALSREAELDYARVMLGLAKFPNLYEKAASSKSQLQLAKILEEAQNKIELRATKRVESTPEPKIKSTGSVDTINAEYQKALAAYAESGKLEDYRKVEAARKRLRG